jgi:hypothetical protein
VLKANEQPIFLIREFIESFSLKWQVEPLPIGTIAIYVSDVEQARIFENLLKHLNIAHGNESIKKYLRLHTFRLLRQTQEYKKIFFIDTIYFDKLFTENSFTPFENYKIKAKTEKMLGQPLIKKPTISL